jgi:hypothetical protein
MNCTCKCWEHKTINVICHKCDGLLSYVRTQTINENDEKQVVLKKLKEELKTKQVDVFLLKQDIKDLEIELESV